MKSRHFNSYVELAGLILPTDTDEQRNDAMEMLVAIGVAKATIWVGLPPKTYRTRWSIHAHNAPSLQSKEAA